MCNKGFTVFGISVNPWACTVVHRIKCGNIIDKQMPEVYNSAHGIRENV